LPSNPHQRIPRVNMESATNRKARHSWPPSAPLMLEATSSTFTSRRISATEAALAVLKVDAEGARAFVRLVAAQESVSSRLIDNLNASVHLRALLTDVFVLGELVGV